MEGYIEERYECHLSRLMLFRELNIGLISLYLDQAVPLGWRAEGCVEGNLSR
jgi:hypothetical protein